MTQTHIFSMMPTSKMNKAHKLLNLLSLMGFILIYFPVKGYGDVYDLLGEQFYQNKECSIKLLYDLKSKLFSNEVVSIRYHQYLTLLAKEDYCNLIMPLYFLDWFFKENETACFMTRDEFAILLEDFIEGDLAKEEFSQILRENFPSFEEIETIRKLYRSLTKLRKKSV